MVLLEVNSMMMFKKHSILLIACTCKEINLVVQMMLQLSYPDIAMQPTTADIKKALARLALCLVESTKLFVRWMDGTCLEAQPIPGQLTMPCAETLGTAVVKMHVIASMLFNVRMWICSTGDSNIWGIILQMVNAGASEDEEPFVHSFYLDVCQSVELKKSLAALSQATQTVLVGLHRYCEGWKRHQSLWNTDKAVALDKFQVPSGFASINPCPQRIWKQATPCRISNF